MSVSIDTTRQPSSAHVQGANTSATPSTTTIPSCIKTIIAEVSRSSPTAATTATLSKCLRSCHIVGDKVAFSNADKKYLCYIIELAR